MDLFKYKLFSKIEEYRSITKAAEALNISQSGASHAIKNLEKEFGLLLINRDHTHISLTNDGIVILDQIKIILELDEQLRQKIDEIKGLESGTVSIGSFTTIMSSWLTSIIAMFQNEHPNIDIILRNGNYSDICNWLSNRYVDLGFLVFPISNNYETIPLYKDEIVCVAPKNHPIANKKSVSFKQIKDEPFIVPAWGKDSDIAWALKSRKFEPNIKFVISEEEAIISLVEKGFGISLLPEMTVKRFNFNITIVRLEDPLFREIFLATRSLNNVTPAVDAFIKFTKLFINEKFRNHNYNG